MRSSLKGLQQILRKSGYGLTGTAGLGLSHAAGLKLQGAKSQRHRGKKPLASASRKAKSSVSLTVRAPNRRFKVVINAYNTRLFDKDNICVKQICDQLRYHAIIPDDNPEAIDLSWNQFKVPHKKDIRTEVFVDIIQNDSEKLLADETNRILKTI